MLTQELAIPKVMSRAKADEELKQLVRGKTGSLIRLARLLLTDAAEDLVQDAFLQAHQALDSFRWECTLHTWVRRILVNLGIKRLRRRKLGRAFTDLFRSTARPGQAPAEPPPQWLGFVERSPEEQTQLREQAQLLLQAMPVLSTRQQAVVTLRYFEGLQVDEIAELMQVGAGTVKTHLGRALRELRLRLGKERDHGTL